MNKLIPLCVLALVAWGAGICFRPYDCTALFGMDESGTRGRLDEYRHVVLVCVSEDYLEVAASKHSIHHFKAHVVRSYKGDWLKSERVNWVHGVDSPMPLQVNTRNDRLMFVFLNQKTGSEITLDTGDFLDYDEKVERVLAHLY